MRDLGIIVNVVTLKITAHLDKMNLLLRHTEEMADYVRKVTTFISKSYFYCSSFEIPWLKAQIWQFQRREEVDNLEKAHFPEGLPAIEK